MRLVFGLVLLLGLGLAGFAVYMAQDYINAHEVALAKERKARQSIVPTTDVFVSTQAVRYGDRLKKEYVRAVRWPVDAVPEGAFTSLEELFPENEDELRTVLRAMEKDEAIMAVKVTRPGEDAGVSSKLAPGMRAFALRVDVASGVSGFLRPGDRVDVYWTGRGATESAGSRDFTRLIEAGVKLIAVDQSADQDRNNPTVARTVTVEATPVQVASLAQAQATGRLQLSLVGAQDDDVAAGSVQVDQRLLLGIEEQVIIKKEAEEICTVRTRRGAEIVEIPIPCTN
ncbi:MAG: Flp pilus assembly protein CpaB [Rhodobacteraceae bacterium]|nr:Flp pilus assembly protein CpaB [Alphaproteobacteria bacterium]MBT8474249.1 Flp pilus assembly protein CpaB [Alphaproteobacteria bacterium]NNF71903.1 Flp pilus assembly protein CpaB [Paracoccaceae bacterium]NNK65462.1 Flp pilus assembly protein CpaB [Paracoccaceae bacterium]